ncbi:MAG: hypothetical protein QM770_03575 [Tepidisphaeraceae bacterium]
MSTLRPRASSKNRLLARAARPVEMLEQRRLLTVVTTNPYDVSDVPEFTPTTDVLKDGKEGPLAKGGQALADLYGEYRSYIRAGGKASNFVSAKKDVYETDGAMLGVSLRTRGKMNDLVRLVRNSGGYLISRASKYNVVNAYLPFGKLRDVAGVSDVVHMRPITQALTNAGSVESEGDFAQMADYFRTAYGVDGTGLKIGVISDSFNSLGGADVDAIRGDLPSTTVGFQTVSAVEVIRDLAAGEGTDEGRAMAQLIYDVAPGASIAFSTCGESVTEFADAIRALADAGCNVIVDDVGFTNEPLFQSGVVGDAASEVTKRGIAYFSAQANSNWAGYQSYTNWVTTGSGERVVDFDPSPNRVDTRMTITFDEPTYLKFSWDNLWNGVVGDVTADVDVRLYDNTAQGGVVFAGEDNNFFTGAPLEVFSIEPGTYEMEIVLQQLAPARKSRRCLASWACRAASTVAKPSTRRSWATPRRPVTRTRPTSSAPRRCPRTTRPPMARRTPRPPTSPAPAARR